MSNNDAANAYHAAKAAVSEIEQRKAAHLLAIETCEASIADLRIQRQSESLDERAEMFFKGEPVGNIGGLQAELQRLHEQTEPFHKEVKRRQRVAAGLRGPHSEAFYAKLRARDIEIKTNMARALIDLAKACEAERILVEEMLNADCQPPAAYRTMKVNFVGRLRDDNSFVRGWLRELKAYYGIELF